MNGAILYGHIQWWTMAQFDVALNFSKKRRYIVKIAKVTAEKGK